MPSFVRLRPTSVVPHGWLAAAILCLGSVCPQASAQTGVSPAFPPASAPAATVPRASAPPPEMPLQDFLGLLRQISPAAEVAATHYLAAWRRQCGRSLTTAELRRAFEEGRGDPMLMAVVRATHEQREGERERLLSQLRCPSEPAR